MVVSNVDTAAQRKALDDAKLEAAIGTRALAELGFATGIRMSLGHTSMRVPGDPGKFVVKGRGYRLDVISKMRPEDMVVCDLDGNWLDGPPNSMQCGEVKLHSCIYRTRPDVVSVTHVHPDYTVLMSVLGVPLRPMAQEGARMMLEPIPVFPQTKIVTSDAEGQAVADLLGQGQAVMLLGHGAVTVSTRDVQGSVMAMAHLEHQARLNYLAVCAMGADHPSIPRPLVEDIGRSNFQDEPHFKARVEQIPGTPSVAAVWDYYRELLGTL